MTNDPHYWRRTFLHIHRVLSVTHRVGDDYRASFAIAIRMRRQLMTQFAQLLRDSEAVMRRRLAWLRRRGLLAPKPPRPALRDLVVDLFTVPDIAPAPT